jgi:hypothetical protein
MKAARSTRRSAFALRLGEVHGDLQPVTRFYVKSVRSGTVTIARGLHSPSNIVTCFTIANALRNIADGQETPGLYTVVERPEWTWEQFYRWVAANCDAEVEINEVATPARPNTVHAVSRAVLARVGAGLFRTAASNKDLITSYLPIPASLEYRFRIEFQRRKAAAEVRDRPMDPTVHDQMLGPVPGPRLRSFRGGNERREAEGSVRRLLDDRLSQQSHHFTASSHWVP